VTEQLFDAIRAGDAAQVAALVAHDPALARARKDGVSAMLFARYCSRPEIVALLRPACGALDIFESAALGDAARARALLDANPALVNAVAEDGFGPLGLASFFGHEEVAALLLSRGGDPARASANAMKVMPLHSAAASRSVAIARLLIGAGAPVDARQGHALGFTPLMEAALNGQDELVELLLRHGANPDLRDAHDMSAADHARGSGHDALAERLDQAAGAV
jgi:ankyrin repeat protein